jgi:hypothetical protein
MMFRTVSGSTYEVDSEAKKIRRVNNSNDKVATERQGNNEWKGYMSLSPIKVGVGVFIAWDPDKTPLLPNSPFSIGVPGTLTSDVVEVIE